MINHLILGAFETNCYILRANEMAKECLIIDTGLEAGDLLKFLKENDLTPKAVVLTHGHADHIIGLAALRQQYPHIKVYIHKLDAHMLTRATSNLSLLAGKFFKTSPADTLLQDGDIVDEADLKLDVFHTPGHTKGGVCLYLRAEDTVFTGDTLFADSVGRTDLPGGNMEMLIQGIKEKLWKLPGNTVVYPGHGPKTTIDREKTYNQYVR